MGRVPVSGEAGPLCFREEEDDETSRRDESHSRIALQATTSSTYPRPLSLLYHLEGCVFTKQKGSSSKLLHYQNLKNKNVSSVIYNIQQETSRPGSSFPNLF